MCFTLAPMMANRDDGEPISNRDDGGLLPGIYLLLINKNKRS